VDQSDRRERLVIFLLLGIPMVISGVLLLFVRPEQWWGALLLAVIGVGFTWLAFTDVG
jgi:hypothetical protein